MYSLHKITDLCWLCAWSSRHSPPPALIGHKVHKRLIRNKQIIILPQLSYTARPFSDDNDVDFLHPFPLVSWWPCAQRWLQVAFWHKHIYSKTRSVDIAARKCFSGDLIKWKPNQCIVNRKVSKSLSIGENERCGCIFQFRTVYDLN